MTNPASGSKGPMALSTGYRFSVVKAFGRPSLHLRNSSRKPKAVRPKSVIS
jgi:hypothetical protein